MMATPIMVDNQGHSKVTLAVWLSMSCRLLVSFFSTSGEVEIVEAVELSSQQHHHHHNHNEFHHHHYQTLNLWLLLSSSTSNKLIQHDHHHISYHHHHIAYCWATSRTPQQLHQQHLQWRLSTEIDGWKWINFMTSPTHWCHLLMNNSANNEKNNNNNNNNHHNHKN